MKAVLSRLLLAVMMVGLASSFAFAQTSKSGLTGLVKDSTGGGIPGATVTVKSNATGVATTVQTNGSGNWGVPQLDSGIYTVTITLANFKTLSYDKVQLTQGVVTNLNSVLEVGGVTDIIKVIAQTQLVETSNTNVTTTINADQINSLPQVTKNALQFVTFLPGVNTGASHVQRSSTLVGLPQSALAITLDGVNVMDQYLKDTTGSSFFALVRPQTDLIEEVTVSEATPGADSSSGGAVQIKFVTRSGSNQPSGSAYEYLRHPSFDTNSFTNTAAFGTGTTDLPKNNIVVNQYGFREGGPIVIPGVYDGHGKAFYFFNYEEFRLPSNVTRNRTVLAPSAQTGQFVYGCTAASGACGLTANLFAVAQMYAATNPVGTLNGVSQPLAAAILGGNTSDVTVTTMLNTIASITGVANFVNTGVQMPGTTMKFNTDRNTIAYSYQPGSLRAEHIPGGRVDFNITTKQRLSATYDFQKVNSNPDELNSQESRFPGLANQGSQYSFRNSGTATLRSTVTANIVNEASWGFLWSPTYFFADMNTSEFDLSGIPGQTGTGSYFGNLAGYVTSPFTGNNVQARNGSNYQIKDTVSWLKGKHSFSFGFNFQQVTGWNYSHNLNSQISLGVDTSNDPSAGMFTTTYFPGANTTELGTARTLYALLTGRVTSIAGTARINPDGSYSYEGLGEENLYERESGYFIQDQWHVKSNVTLNLGLRYELDFPIVPTTAVYSVNSFSDFCGQVGQGGVSPAATEAVTMGLPCQFGIPGYAPGATPYVYTQADFNAGVITNPLYIGTSKCIAAASDSAAGTGLSNVAPCPTWEKYTPNTSGWNVDTNNFAPSIGVAWQPNLQHGIGRKILGDPALATVRASYSRSFNTIGINTLQATLENGPGLTFNASRNTTNQNLCPGGGNNCFPLLYTPTLTAGGIGAPAACTSTTPANGCVPSSLSFPLPVALTNTARLYDPNYQTPYSDSYSVGLQRSISRDMSMEIRYIRTRSYAGDTTRNYSEQNTITAPFGSSSNFQSEFQAAQANLVINIRNGKAATFAPQAGNGPNGFLPGEQALPILLASYEGSNFGTGSTGCGIPTQVYAYGGTNASAFCPGAADAKQYTSTQFTNTSNLQALSLIRPNENNFALTSTTSTSDLFYDPTFRANGISAGMPINFWVANPDVGADVVETAQGYTKYDSVQLILTRRLSKGLQVSANYSYQIQYGSQFLTFYQARTLVRDPSAPPNSFKLLVNYDLPVGKGKRFGTNMPTWLDAVIGNWQLNMTSRVENGALVDIGNVQLNNMTLANVQNAFHYYRNTVPQVITTWSTAQSAWVPFTTTPDGRWYDLPIDIITNSARAFSVDPKQLNGYTACSGTSTTCNGPAPGSRYFSPASTLAVDANGNVTGCSALFVSSCGIRDQFIVAPLFTRFEFSAKKRFPFARRGSFDIEVDALNLFNAIDFNNAFSNSGGNVVGSAYQDVSNTFDPGGRLVQLVFRVNW